MWVCEMIGQRIISLQLWWENGKHLEMVRCFLLFPIVFSGGWILILMANDDSGEEIQENFVNLYIGMDRLTCYTVLLFLKKFQDSNKCMNSKKTQKNPWCSFIQFIHLFKCLSLEHFRTCCWTYLSGVMKNKWTITDYNMGKVSTLLLWLNKQSDIQLNI